VIGGRAVLASFVLATRALVTTSSAAAEPVRVVLLRPAMTEAATTEALIRIRGELVADGFQVELIDPPAAATPEDALSLALHGQVDPSAAAVVGISLDPDAHAAELWVVDRITNKRLTRRIDTSGVPHDHIAQVLAVRSVELLRVSLLELLIDARRPPEPQPAASPPPEVRQTARRWAERPLATWRWGLEAGASVLGSLALPASKPHPGGLGPAALFTGRLRFAPIRPLQVRLTFAGIGTSPRVDGPQGSSAAVSQLLGLAEVAWIPWPDLRARPMFSLGAGALHVAVNGAASFPYQGAHSAEWAGAADAGTGVEVQLVPRISVAVEGHALVAVPYPIVRFLDDQAARVASPGLLGSLTLVGWL
jgi:hypothetical protein